MYNVFLNDSREIESPKAEISHKSKTSSKYNLIELKGEMRSLRRITMNELAISLKM